MVIEELQTESHHQFNINIEGKNVEQTKQGSGLIDTEQLKNEPVFTSELPKKRTKKKA